MSRVRHRIVIAVACVGLAGAFWARTAAQGGTRDVPIEGNNFAFSPARIEVQQDDLVKVTFTAADMPHSFVIDAYRIVKRAGAGQTVVFEFRADKPGTYTYYCNLQKDDRCRKMRGELVVRGR
jgi:heme/copper-type cytochrome/quinol oxidase subunit 2